MRKFKFNRIKKNNPESRIWKRTWEYQKTRNNLAKALKKWNENDEKLARMDYLVEKTVSEELLTESEKKFIISLPKEDLDTFLWSLFKKLMEFVDWIHASGSMDADELDEWDVQGFLAINKMYWRRYYLIYIWHLRRRKYIWYQVSRHLREQPHAIYDLQGRRLPLNGCKQQQTPQKGVYIQNGKKYIVK